jgi:hypothetical protein
MKQLIIDGYEVRESDGGGMSSNLVAYVSSLSLANELVDKNKGWRHHNPIKKIITVFDTMQEIEENSKKALRESALAKLSDAEKDALGLFK